MGPSSKDRKDTDAGAADRSAGASRIAVLPPALADQIAAGEVVERAASVVKELCENAIDAGARRVEVDIEGGGRRLVRVVDDGSGMTPDEARLALRRHATSKIRSADDLWGLATFGFRGEALPSIAAVSRLTLATKVAGAAVGFQLTVEGGAELDAREVGIPPGTQIEIRDLFFNTPARLKFQKTEATEAANVSEAVLRLALAHPDVHFRLRAGGRMVLDLPVHHKLGERVRAAFARRGAGALHEAWGEEGGHQVRAFLAAPDEASATARATFLFVGRRFIRDRNLLHALALGYGDLLDKGRYPLAALFLDVPGADLDINVHPQKTEVRFARAAEVYAAVRHVVGAGVAVAPWLDSARGARQVHTLPPESPPGSTPFPSPLSRGARGPGPGAERFPTRAGETFASAFDHLGGERQAPGEGRFSPWRSSSTADWRDPDRAPEGTYFRSLRYVGQFEERTLVCEGRGELVLVDRHAAHELVALKQLRHAMTRGRLAGQKLLFPIPIDVGGDGARTALAHAGRLKSLGFDLEPGPPGGAAGGGGGAGEGDPSASPQASDLLLRAVPELLKDLDPKPLLRELLAVMADGAEVRGVDALLSTMACQLAHHLVRLDGRGGGDSLAPARAQSLLAQLDGVDVWGQRPHGRSLLLRFPSTELDRRFGVT